MHDDSNDMLIGMYPIKWLLSAGAREMYPINMQLSVCHCSISGNEISFHVLYSTCTENLNKHNL